MTEDDIITMAAGLPGVVLLTATAENGSPESAWGDSFFFYDPDGDTDPSRRLPFATIVVSDYPGFDTLSELNREGVFRLNINVGRKTFENVLGYPPSAHAVHHDGIDYAAVDVVLPHPVYAAQAWVSVLNPDRTAEQAATLLIDAHGRAAARHRPGRHE